MHKISQLIRIKVPVQSFSTPTRQNRIQFWQNLADIANIADIADIIVGISRYLPSPPNYIIAKYLKKNHLFLL